jgi:hypothetical protein
MRWTPEQVGRLTLRQVREIVSRDPYKKLEEDKESERRGWPTRDEVAGHRWRYFRRKPWAQASR